MTGFSFGFGLNGRGFKGISPIISAVNIAPQNYDIGNYNDDQGAVVIELNHRDNATPYSFTNFEHAFYIGDGTNDNRVAVIFSSGGIHYFRVATGGVIQATVDAGLHLAFVGRVKKIGVRWKNGTVTLYSNGALLKTFTGVTMPTSVSAIGAGQLTNGSLKTSAKFDASTVGANVFKVYDKDPGDISMRNLTRNTSLVTGLTGDTSRKGIVFAGQSNSSGRAASNVSLVNTPKLLANDGTYGDYSDPYDDDTGTLIQNQALGEGGEAGSYAGKVLDDLITSEGGEWFAVPANRGGTPLVNQSTSFNVRDANDFMNLPVYALIMRCFMGMQAAGGKPLHGLVWHQGEQDAVNGESAEDYRNAAIALFAEIRAALGYEIPIYFVSLHEWDAGITSATEADWNTISDELLNLPNHISNSYAVNIQDVAGAAGDKIHLDVTGNTTVGARIAAAIAA